MSDRGVPGAGLGGAVPGGQPGQQGQPSEEEVRAYLAQLRQSDVNGIVAQAFSLLASGAEVKLGRRDGRLLIDAAAELAGAVGDKLDSRLKEQMDEALDQLRRGQVDAEGQLKQLRAEGKLPDDEEGDLPADGSPKRAADDDEDVDAATAPPAQPGQQPGPARGRPQGDQPGGSKTDRLWIPGR